MELRQLEYFVAVAEEASFTKAAARLFVAQPGVSTQIRRLESELGQELLDRTGRTVKLTEAGTAVLVRARDVLNGVAGIQLVIDEFTGLVRGRVTIGVVRACAGLDLPALLADFHKEYPDVEVTLAEDNSDRLIENVQSGQLDAALVALTATTPPGVNLHVFVDEPLVIAVSSSDQLAERSAVSIDVLRDRRLVSLPRGTGMRACLDEACAVAGFVPYVAFEVSDPVVLAELAMRDLGPAVLPASLAAGYHGKLSALTVDPPGLHGRMALAWRAQDPVSPATRAFVAHARFVLGPSVENRGQATA
ncbi:LysR family transcriptional regulator [Streptomyces sp. NPDC002889]|uniref:LysR family transcriptional regulator n=1 Tax=Streptomyces sp. NPDC002889 TaxID=3364669 RepID=UPI0036C54596